MKKAERELLKKHRMNVKSNIKDIIKKHSYKSVRGEAIYKKVDDYFISGQYYVRYNDNKYFLDIKVGIKKLTYDNLFWSIMDMESNQEQPLSFRAIGAFVSPSFPICKFTYELEKDCDGIGILDDMIDAVEKEVEKSLKIDNLNDEIIRKEINMWQYDSLKILAYIDSLKYDEAIAYTESELRAGRTGAFMNGEESFNELALKYCKAVKANNPII